MSVCPDGSHVFRTRNQLIYVGNRKIDTIFVGEECVYPDTYYQKYSIWVPLDDAICTSYDNQPIDKAGILLYTTGPAEITKCCVYLVSDYQNFPDNKGNRGLCDACQVGIRCRYPDYVELAAFGTYCGEVVYDYHTQESVKILSVDRKYKNFYISGFTVYNILTDEGRGIRIASGTAQSDGAEVVYTQQAFENYMSTE